jgi:hypothetical protein
MTLTLEPQTQADYQLFLELAKRLGVRYKKENDHTTDLLEIQQEHDFLQLAGAWQDEESTDAFINRIESARTSKTLDIDL